MDKIEIEFENYMSYMYGRSSMSQEQDEQLQKAFYAGMFSYQKILFEGLESSASDDEVIEKMELASGQLYKKMMELL